MDLRKIKTLIELVEALEEEYTPPAEALSRRGLQTQLVGIYAVGSHSFDLAKAVSHNQVDFAIMWGEVQGSATGRYVRWTFRYREWLFLAELEAIGLARLDSNEPRSVRHLREFQDRSLRSRIGVLPLRAFR